jgi:protein O-mannosyl-transferase
MLASTCNRIVARNKAWIILISLTVITLLAFWQVKDCDFINFDDNVYITKNNLIQNGLTIDGIRWAFTTTHVANWHPLTWISHMLDIQLYGLNPRGHHLTNLLFHIANTLLLFLILNRMTQALWQSAIVATLFAIHPLHVESVAWVAERKDVLSTFFWMLTMGAYIFYVERPGLKRYLAVLVLFALGLMAKPMLVTLPFVLLLLDYWPLKRFKLARVPQGTGQPTGPEHSWQLLLPFIREKVPLFVLSLFSCIVTYFTQTAAMASIEAFPLTIRVSNAFVSYLFYIDKMIWPTDLALLYPHPREWPGWLFLGAALPTITVTYLALRKAKLFPYLAVGWFWYLGTLVPVIGLVQVGSQTRADRYTYVPLIGLFIILAWGIPEIINGWRYRKAVLAAFSAFILLCLFFVTYTQVGYWQNSISLFDHTISVTNRNSVMYNNRGSVYLDSGDYSRAIKDFDKATEINRNYANPYYNRGMAYGKLGDHSRALEEFNTAIAINPKYDMAYYNRGMAYGQLGRSEKGYEDLKTAARLGSEDAKKFLESHKVNWQ